MKRVMFLDDNPARRQWAREELGPGNLLSLAENAGGAIAALAVCDHDEVYLDHDLEGVDQNPAESNTGSEVVRWIVANRPAIGRIVVHSLNAPAANAMVNALTDAGYAAVYFNFLRLVEGGAA